jgi:hypothetical protein
MFEARDFPGGLDRVGMVCLAIYCHNGRGPHWPTRRDSRKPAGESRNLRAQVAGLSPAIARSPRRRGRESFNLSRAA